MQDLRSNIPASERATVSAAGVFMQHVYTWMTAALLVTAASAYFTMKSPAVLSFFFSGFLGLILLCVATFGLVFYLNAKMAQLSAAQATGFYLLFAVLMGVLMGPTLLVYTSASVTKAFVVTAGMFGGMSVFGYVTKRDLSGMGSFLVMGLWGLILAMVVNMFLGSPAIDFAISVVGVIVFAGLTAWDTQKLRQMGENAPLDDALAIRRGAILGAMQLYLDFINMFLFLLRLFGNRD